MTHYLNIKPISEADLPRCMELVIPSFDFMSISDILHGPNTATNRQVLSEIHWQTIQQHLTQYPESTAVGIKCVHVNRVTGDETIVGYAEWFIYSRPRTRDECLEPLGFMQSRPKTGNQDEHNAILKYFRPSIETRADIMGTQPYGLLLWLCVDRLFQRQGAASRLVRWGMDQCAKLGIPAYLEASEQGKGLYEALGWQVLQHPRVRDIGYPIMMWWPDGSQKAHDVDTDP